MGGFLPSRRRFLGGAGAVLGLPFLESALPRAARAQTQPLLRFLPVFIPNGVDKRGWIAKGQIASGADFTTANAPILRPLAPIKAKVLVLDGLGNVAGFGLHEKATRSFLTCQETPGGDTNDGAGISIDQAVANAVGGQTRIPSLQLGVFSGGYATINWKGAGQGLPPVASAQQIFDKIFAGYEANVSQAEIDRRRRYETSVLDYVVGEIASLSPKLGRTDRLRLEQHTTYVREIERQINNATPVTCTRPAAAPAGSGYQENLKNMMDLAVLAFQCDATRVATIMSNTGNSSHPWLGIGGGHHDLSHWGSDVSKRDQVQKINVWEFEQYAYLLQKMDAIDEGGGKTLLDNSFVFVSSEINEGDGHGWDNLPFVVGGNLAGKFPAYGGKYIRVRGPGGQFRFKNDVVFGYGDNIPVSWLYVSILNAFGVQATTFGVDTIRGDLLKTGQLG